MDSEAVCSICLDRLNQSSSLSILSTRQEKDGKVKVRLEPCKHEFHRACIERWLAGNQRLSCAYCRTKAKLLICSSSNQVLKTLHPHPPRSHSLHVSSGIMERTILTMLSSGDMSTSSSRRRVSRGNSGPSYPSSSGTRSAFASTGSSSESDARTASHAGGRWIMQKFRRLRERMENSNNNNNSNSSSSNNSSSNSGNNPITPSPSAANVLNLLPSLDQTLEQFAETVDIVSQRLTPSTWIM